MYIAATAGMVSPYFICTERGAYFPPDVASTLTNLIIDGISSHSTLLDSYVVLHAALISSLHKLIGTAFGTCLTK